MKRYKINDLYEPYSALFNGEKGVIALLDIVRKKYEAFLYAKPASDIRNQSSKDGILCIEFTIKDTNNTVSICYDVYVGFTITLNRNYYDERAKSWWDVTRTTEFRIMEKGIEWESTYLELVKFINDVENKFDFIEENVETMLHITKVYYS